MLDLNLLTGWKAGFVSLGGLLVGFSMIYGVIICPLIIHFKVLPRIEKGIDKKLEYPKFYDVYPFAFLCRLGEIPFCIGIEYFLSYFKKSTKNINFFKNYALIKVDFELKNFKKSDIFLSILFILSIFIFFVLGGILYFIGV